MTKPVKKTLLLAALMAASLLPAQDERPETTALKEKNILMDNAMKKRGIPVDAKSFEKFYYNGSKDIADISGLQKIHDSIFNENEKSSEIRKISDSCGVTEKLSKEDTLKAETLIREAAPFTLAGEKLFNGKILKFKRDFSDPISIPMPEYTSSTTSHT